MLDFTGHPFVDVGVATITAFAGKSDPRKLTADDLSEVARYIEENYTRNPLRSFLTVAFTSNAWFVQDAYNPDKPGLSDLDRQKRRDTRKLWANRHLHAWKSVGTGLADASCVFTGEPVVTEPLSGKLSSGRAGRAQIPLLQGDDNINFYPGGDSGIPISGTALLCFQAFPLGCAKVGGSLLAVHADDNRLTYRFARLNLQHNLSAVSVAQASNGDKLEESAHSLGTLLVGTLLDISRQRASVAADEELPPSSVTAYHLNNGKTPKLDMYFIPMQVARFLHRVTSAQYRSPWDTLASHAWQQPPKPTSAKGKSNQIPFTPRRNYMYEDILRLPEDAPGFIRRYFLRSALSWAREDDPRRAYSPIREAALVSWELTHLFLTEVLQMESGRIEQVRQLGDRLAGYVHGENDRRFFRAVLTERRYAAFRLALIQADLRAVRHRQGPLLTFDQYVEIFEDGEDVPRVDWLLARDLVLIRMIEQLHANGWLATNVDELSQAVEQVSDENAIRPATEPATGSA